MKLIDPQGQEHQLPSEITKYNLCEDIHIISPDNRLILFTTNKPAEKFSNFVVYNIEHQKSYIL